MRRALACCCLWLLGWSPLAMTWAAEEPQQVLEGLPRIWSCNFSEPDAIKRFEFTDANAWRISELPGGRRVLEQYKPSNYNPPVRSPLNRSIVADVVVSDFVLDVQAQSTVRDYGHRDLCLFFGYQDPSHFYYVHIAKTADDHANQIFIVNNEPRRKISLESTAGTNWDDAWHHLRLQRRVDTGEIRVFFDDMEKPIMRAEDRTFTWGRVGVGSFDDAGRFDQIAVFGRRVEPSK